MSSQKSTMAYLLEQLSSVGNVTARAMFGEYAVYCDGKVVALVCDDQLFVKLTKAGQAHVGEVVEAPPYSGAKPHMLVDGEKWEDGEWLSKLIRLTADALPVPKVRKKRDR